MARSHRPRGCPTRAEPTILDMIKDISGLAAGDVALRRVLCPACGTKIFEKWPLGWDAHAAHRCPGLSGATAEDRKTEFKNRFRHLFL